MSNYYGWPPPPSYGSQGERIVYVPMPGPTNTNNEPEDPIAAYERQALNSARFAAFLKSQQKEEKKDEKKDKKIMGLSESDFRWILILTAPLTGSLMLHLYAYLYMGLPTLVK